MTWQYSCCSTSDNSRWFSCCCKALEIYTLGRHNPAHQASSKGEWIKRKSGVWCASLNVWRASLHGSPAVENRSTVASRLRPRCSCRFSSITVISRSALIAAARMAPVSDAELTSGTCGPQTSPWQWALCNAPASSGFINRNTTQNVTTQGSKAYSISTRVCCCGVTVRTVFCNSGHNRAASNDEALKLSALANAISASSGIMTSAIRAVDLCVCGRAVRLIAERLMQTVTHGRGNIG